MANPLIRNIKQVSSKPMPTRSAGILDDFAVRKTLATRQGTIEHTPSASSDITNKGYVDNRTSHSDHHDYTEYEYNLNGTLSGSTFKLGGSTGDVVFTTHLEYNAQGDINQITTTRDGVVIVENFAYTYNGFNQPLTITIT